MWMLLPYCSPMLVVLGVVLTRHRPDLLGAGFRTALHELLCAHPDVTRLPGVNFCWQGK